MGCEPLALLYFTFFWGGEGFFFKNAIFLKYVAAGYATVRIYIYR
jgi:hypothetical protein